MADSSEPAFLFLYRKGAVAPVDYLSTFATAPSIKKLRFGSHCGGMEDVGPAAGGESCRAGFFVMHWIFNYVIIKVH